MSTERKSRISEKELVETGALLSDIDEQVRFDKLSDRVEDLINVLDRLGGRLEHLDEKFDNKLEHILEKIDGKINSINERVHTLERELTKLEERVAGITQLQGKNWTHNIEKLFENEKLQVGFFVFVGWLVSKAGPSAWEVLLKLLGG